MIKQKLQDEQITALKSGNKDKLSILRYILAQIQNKEIEKLSDLTDEETMAVLKKIAKELKESIEAFKRGTRNDLVDEYTRQLKILTPYLNQKL